MCCHLPSLVSCCQLQAPKSTMAAAVPSQITVTLQCFQSIICMGGYVGIVPDKIPAWQTRICWFDWGVDLFV